MKQEPCDSQDPKSGALCVMAKGHVGPHCNRSPYATKWITRCKEGCRYSVLSSGEMECMACGGGRLPDFEVRVYIDNIGIQLDLNENGDEVRLICRDEVTPRQLRSFLDTTCRMLVDLARPQLFSERRETMSKAKPKRHRPIRRS